MYTMYILSHHHQCVTGHKMMISQQVHHTTVLFGAPFAVKMIRSQNDTISSMEGRLSA